MIETEVLNTKCPTKLLALERAIELAKEQIPADKLHSAQFMLVAADEAGPMRFRVWYDGEAPSRPAEIDKPKRKWWQFWRAA